MLFIKYLLLVVALPAFMLSGCNARNSSDNEISKRWQEELLLQLDELRQKQIALEKDVTELKVQLIEAEKAPQPKKTIDKKVREIPFTAPFVLGDKYAKIAILEISDFECPFCARHARDVFPKLKAEFMDKGIVQYGLLDYPLSFHPGAKEAAVAVRCAGEQGKYWDMYTDIFADRGKTRKEHYKPLAENLGLDLLTYTACFNNPATTAAVNADIAFANKLGIDGTPRFLFGYLNNGQLTDVKLLKGARDFDAFKAILDEMQGL